MELRRGALTFNRPLTCPECRSLGVDTLHGFDRADERTLLRDGLVLGTMSPMGIAYYRLR